MLCPWPCALLFISPLSKIIGRHSTIKFHFYAGNTQLFVHLSYKNATLALDKFISCLQDVQDWMLSGMLNLNPEETDFIIFGSYAQLKKLVLPALSDIW